MNTGYAITPNVTVTDLSDKDDDGSLSVTNNGLPGATFVGLEKGDTATIKLTYPGGYVFTTKFVSTSSAKCNDISAKKTTLKITAANDSTLDLNKIVADAGITATDANGDRDPAAAFTVVSVSTPTGSNVTATKRDSGAVVETGASATVDDNQDITVVIKNTTNNKTITITVKVELS